MKRIVVMGIVVAALVVGRDRIGRWLVDGLTRATGTWVGSPR